jgi:glycosyltransferase involved in cell wall biosynthesis
VKILQVCPEYYPSIGGVQEHVKNICERLAQKYDVSVFTTGDSRLPREEVINGVTVERFRSFSPGNAYYFSADMANRLTTNHYDIIHAHNYHAFPLYFSSFSKCRKYVVTPHYHRNGVTPWRNILVKLYKPFGNRIFQRADKVILTCEFERSLVLSDFNINYKKTIVIPNGLNLRDYTAIKRSVHNKRIILCVARLEEFKGIQYTIQALPLLEKDICLEIVGVGSYESKLVELADKLGVRQRVHFYHGLRGRELVERYVNADIFMLLSRFETYAITLLEALAARTPCIVANTASLKSCIDNKNCFGIDFPVNISHLADVITGTIGKRAGDYNILDWDQVAKQVESIYLE